MGTSAPFLWSDFKSSLLKKKNNDTVLKSWLDSVLSTEAQKHKNHVLFVVNVPSDLHKKWLQAHVADDFQNKLARHFKEPCRVKLEVVPQLPTLKKPSKPTYSPTPSASTSLFNPEYIFDNFIAGTENQFVYKACLSVTEPKISFNPLFIYGPSGLGKTHLLNAIGQKILQKNPDRKVLYLSAERFLNECVQSIQKKEMHEFRKKYRKSCSVLLVDDIQMITKGEAVQEEFFHTFNDLLNNKIQIVICCDKTPSQIPRLEERIKTRFEGGLLADISHPHFETRLAIIKHKTKLKGLFLSESFQKKVAQTCLSSIREIEGVLNKVKMMSELHGGGLSCEQLEPLLKGLAQPDLTAEEIQKRVAHKFGLSCDKLKLQTRKKHIVRARQTAMYFIKKHLKISLNDVGVLFNKKDHTTVLNSIRKVEKLQTENAEFSVIFKDLDKEIHNFNRRV